MGNISTYHYFRTYLVSSDSHDVWPLTFWISGHCAGEFDRHVAVFDRAVGGIRPALKSLTIVSQFTYTAIATPLCALCVNCELFMNVQGRDIPFTK